MTRIRDYVRNGPEEGGNSIVRRMVGLWLHWRTWATLGVLLTGMFLASYMTAMYGVDAMLYVFFTGAFTMHFADKVGDTE